MAGVELASSPVTADHDPCLWMAYWVMAEGVSWHLWDAPSRGIHLDNTISMAVRMSDGLMDVLVLLPLSGIL